MSDLPDAEFPVTREIVLDVTLPATKPVARVEARRIRMLAGVAGGLHVHNSPVFGTILAGSAIYQVEGQPERLLAVGDVFYEPENTRIARFDAQGSGVTFIGFFAVEAGEEATLTVPE